MNKHHGRGLNLQLDEIPLKVFILTLYPDVMRIYEMVFRRSRKLLHEKSEYLPRTMFCVIVKNGHMACILAC